MMAARKPPRPTDGELALLKILWRCGPSTVRQVQETVPAGQRSGYTTVLKLLQIMHDKGLVERDESRRRHVYWARWPEARTLEQLVGDLLQRAFDGSASQLVLRALSAKRASPEEIAEVREMLDALTEEES